MMISKINGSQRLHKIHHFDTAGRLNRVVHIDVSADIKQPSGKGNTDTATEFNTHGSAGEHGTINTFPLFK